MTLFKRKIESKIENSTIYGKIDRNSGPELVSILCRFFLLKLETVTSPKFHKLIKNDLKYLK